MKTKTKENNITVLLHTHKVAIRQEK